MAKVSVGLLLKEHFQICTAISLMMETLKYQYFYIIITFTDPKSAESIKEVTERVTPAQICDVKFKMSGSLRRLCIQFSPAR